MRPLLVSIRILGVLSLVSLALCSPDHARACSCLPPPSVGDALAASEAVFTGRVIEVEVGDFGSAFHEKRVRLEVELVWKGDLSDVATVFTGTGDADCGIDFRLDVDYLVYADESGSLGVTRLSTYLCGRTATADGNPDLGELGPPITPTLQTSWGTVKLLWR